MGFINSIECENCHEQEDTTNKPFGYIPSGWIVLVHVGDSQKMFCSDKCVAGYENVRKLIKVGNYTIDEWIEDLEKIIYDGANEVNLMQYLGNFKLALQHRHLGEG